jgi:GAF domain-containing protein
MVHPDIPTDQPLHPGLLDLLGEAARSLAGEPTLQQTLDAVVEYVRDMVPGCADAGISLSRDGQLTTAASTDAGVRVGDQWQYELGQGPCVEAIRSEEIVWSPDVASDQRWPQWGARAAAELGVASMLCFQLYTSESTHGALNLYGTEVDAFTAADRVLAGSFAAVAAAAIRSAETEDQLHSAVASRMMIGQAQGILMERFNLSASNAFAVLSRISQHTNTKLVTVADEIVRTRKVPGTTA